MRCGDYSFPLYHVILSKAYASYKNMNYYFIIQKNLNPLTVLFFSSMDHKHNDFDIILSAFESLKSKTVDGQIIVERVVPKLSKLSFCKKGEPSEIATKRYHEILENLGV